MTRLILTNDIHMAFKGPVTRLDDWPEALFAKLEQVGTLARKLGAGAVLIAGDFFHMKSRSSFAIIYRLMDWCYALKRDGILVIGVPGNHDEVHERLDSVSTQPLGLLFKSGAVIDASYDTVTVNDVAITGIPYPDARDLENWERLPKPLARHSIVMAHYFATPQGGQVFADTYLSYGELTRFPFNVFHFGHDHSDHGVSRIDTPEGSKFFVNVGALGRGSIAKEDISRDVKVAVVEFHEGETKVQQVRLKVSPAGEIFDLTLKAQKDRERQEIEQFVGQLSSDLATTGRVDFGERVGRLDLPDVVRKRVIGYIEAAESAVAVQ